MKVRILYGIAACIIFIIAVLIFLDFWKQWKAALTFQGRVVNSSLNVRHLLIAPEQVKVKNWQVGDSAVYRLRTNTENKQVSFHVAAQDSNSSNRFWLKTTGLSQFNGVDIEFWRLLESTNLRPGGETRGFHYCRDAIPFPLRLLKFPSYPIVLEKLENQALVTPIGRIECEHAFAYIRSPDGELEPLLELWTNPSVRPLGIVRARWQEGSLDLVQTDANRVQEMPPVLLAEFDRNTPTDGSCTRCHAEGIGGKDLKLGFINWLSGEALNLTTALFHHQQAKILKQDSPIHIHFPKKRSRRAKKLAWAQFSWENGGIWVKPDKTGRLVFSLDTVARQSNIIVRSNMGRLALEFKNEAD